MDRYRKQWEALGAHDPYWAVLTDPAGKGGSWDRQAFFASGEAEVGRMLATLARLDATPRPGVALDFGCGVGRLSRALARRFDCVIGIDVAASMLDEARAQHGACGNIRFVHNTATDLACIGDASVDLVYSSIVLQHMPAARQLAYIAEFCRVLGPGGVAVLQTPSAWQRNSLRGQLMRLAGNRVMNLVRAALHGRHGVMEIHPLASERVRATLQAGGLDLLRSQRERSAGPGLENRRYFARKR